MSEEGRDHGSRPTLYVVATPLGNLDDFSPRAARVLTSVDVIYAEDTRRSRILLDRFGILKPLLSLHEHNEHERCAAVLAALAQGKSLALLTDAGTPAVSDPGAVVVASVVKAGFCVCPIPGASALTTALSVAGFPPSTAGTLFIGFLPARGSARQAAVSRVVAHCGMVVLFEAPHRLHATLVELAEHRPLRQICVARELTKIHEEIRHGTLADLAQWAEAGVRGELTLVLAPFEPEADISAVDTSATDDMLVRCLGAGLSTRDAAAAVAALSGRPRRELYGRCQQLKGGE